MVRQMTFFGTTVVPRLEYLPAGEIYDYETDATWKYIGGVLEGVKVCEYCGKVEYVYEDEIEPEDKERIHLMLLEQDECRHLMILIKRRYGTKSPKSIRDYWQGFDEDTQDLPHPRPLSEHGEGSMAEGDL